MSPESRREPAREVERAPAPAPRGPGAAVRRRRAAPFAPPAPTEPAAPGAEA